MTDERTLAIRSLVRRGTRSIDAAAKDAAIAELISHRNFRGNVSQQKGRVKSSADLDALRAKRRAKLEAKSR